MKLDNTTRIRTTSGLRERLVAEMKKTLTTARKNVDAYLVPRLNDALVYAWSHSPFYIDRFKRKQLPERIRVVNAGSVNSFRQVAPTSSAWNGEGEWASIPFTTKEDLRREYPFGFLAVPRSRLTRYGESTGSSGSPTSSFMTETDWERGSVWVELSLLSFFSEQDTVFIAIPYELSFAAPDLDQAFRNVGATVVAIGTLNSVCPWERTLEMMRVLHPSTLVCTPSRALRLYDMFVDKGLDPTQVGLKNLLYVGETCSQAKLAKIAKLWGINLCTAYGTTETNSLGLSCNHGRVHLLEDRFYFEVIDPKTGELVADGERGELVLTTLSYEAMPLVRYRSGDAVKIENEPCPCGIPLRTVRHYGRVSDCLEVTGKTLPTIELEDTVLSVEGTGCYFAAGIDEGRLVVFVDVLTSDFNEVRAKIQQRIAHENGVSAEIRCISKQNIGVLMDRMLKPGGITFSQVLEAAGPQLSA